MNSPKIVCPNNKRLLKGLAGYSVVVRVDELSQAVGAAADVRDLGISLACLIVDSNLPLDQLALSEDQKAIPLVIVSPSMGKFRNLAERLERLRAMNVRIYLPCDGPGNSTALKILSSLGINGCALIGREPTDWEALSDLMTYALLERTPHAPIEPFEFIASHYNPLSTLNWRGVYFDDPAQFLHMDAKGRIALTAAELKKKRFIAQSLEEIGEAAAFPAIKDRQQEWRRFFVENHPCASCNGWKICMGMFSAALDKDQGCSRFFREMIEVTRQYRTQKPSQTYLKFGS
jgi:hypothetical protein